MTPYHIAITARVLRMRGMSAEAAWVENLPPKKEEANDL